MPVSELLHVQDFIWLPLILATFLLYAFSKLVRYDYARSFYKNYLFDSVFVRLFGLTLGLLVILIYYKGHGDPVGVYFLRISKLREVFESDLVSVFKYIVYGGKSLNDVTQNLHLSPFYYTSTGTTTVVQIGLFFSLFCNNSFLSLNLIFTLLSLMGTWKLCEVFLTIFPNHPKAIAISFLFLPSLCLWATGLSKESLVLFGMGYLTSAFYKFIILKRRKWRYLVLLIVMSMLLIKVKTYIFLFYGVALFSWYLIKSFKRIPKKDRLIYIPISFFFLLIIAIGLGSISSSFSERLSFDAVGDFLRQKYHYATHVRPGGSSYSIPELKESIISNLSIYPKLLAIGMFEPYLWQSKKPIIMLSGLETLAFLLLTIWMILKVRLRGMFNMIINSPVLLSILVFTFLLAPAAALVSGNYGTLVRYRMPFLPFLSLFLLILIGSKKLRITFSKKE